MALTEDEIRTETSKLWTSGVGYYWPGLSYSAANELIETKSVGSFLIRRSTNANHLFTIVVKTASNGVKNLRIHQRRNAQNEMEYTVNVETGPSPMFKHVSELIERLVDQQLYAEHTPFYLLTPVINPLHLM